MPANFATWTSERIELLKRYQHAGLSCSQIAREIGVTRNAVIGKMNRLEHLTRRLNRLWVHMTARIGFNIPTGTKGPVMNGEALF
jgi:hypothetical protein